jgi:hypothetical protein
LALSRSIVHPDGLECELSLMGTSVSDQNGALGMKHVVVQCRLHLCQKGVQKGETYGRLTAAGEPLEQLVQLVLLHGVENACILSLEKKLNRENKKKHF